MHNHTEIRFTSAMFSNLLREFRTLGYSDVTSMEDWLERRFNCVYRRGSIKPYTTTTLVFEDSAQALEFILRYA